MRVMLSLLPFWAPLTPPLGLGILKSHLQSAGADVVLEDFNADSQLWSILHRYHGVLKAGIDPALHGNLFEFTYDVLRNHVMAHAHGAQDPRYPKLVSVLVETTFGAPAPYPLVQGLIELVDELLRAVEVKVLEAVARNEPDWLGVSTYTTTLGATVVALRAVRKAFPRVRTVLGGGIFADHVEPRSANFEAFLAVSEPYLDAIVIGEGEHLLTQVVAGKLPGKRVYTSADVRRERLAPSEILAPDFDGLDLSLYSQMSTHIGRSCPFQCSFCSETVQWGQYRTRPIDRWITELQTTTRRYGGRAFFLAESLINPVADEAFAATRAAGLDLYFDAYLRADPEVCDPQRVRRWREGGFYRARLGIESGSAAVLAAMNKQTAPDQIRTALHTLAAEGIKTTTYWVIGHPGETEADFEDSLRLIEACGADIYEAEPHGFYFYPRGQVASRKWSREGEVIDLYGAEFADLLVTRSFRLKTAPSRADLLRRVARFTAFTRDLGIANPYSLREIGAADHRWIAGHSRAGPPLIELHNVNHPPDSSATLAERARRIRGRAVRMIHAAGEGHYGGSLSMIDILSVLFDGFVDRARGDRFILSKGHGAPGYYAAMAEFGWIPAAHLERYGRFGSALQGHPDMTLESRIDFSTGSLGQGLSAALGMALIMRGTSARPWVLLGDGECQEGQIWEAALVAARLRIGNLTAIIDANGRQECTYSRDGKQEVPVANLAAKWRAFGWHALEADGHDHRDLTRALRELAQVDVPGVLIARTVKGYGSSLLTTDPDRFHCGELSDVEYHEVLEELG
jgi:transketolase N-terminal domain/subunit